MKISAKVYIGENAGPDFKLLGLEQSFTDERLRCIQYISY